MSKRVPRVSKRRLTLFGTASLVAIIYFGFSFFYNIYTIYSLNIEKDNLENEYIELQEEAEELNKDITKLSDEEYLANYARENYLYSKDGEYILKLDEDLNNIEDNKNIILESINDIAKNINKHYIVVTLCGIIMIFTIFLILKGNKKRKKG